MWKSESACPCDDWGSDLELREFSSGSRKNASSCSLAPAESCSPHSVVKLVFVVMLVFRLLLRLLGPPLPLLCAALLLAALLPDEKSEPDPEKPDLGVAEGPCSVPRRQPLFR